MSNSKKRKNSRNQHNAVSVSNSTSSSTEKHGNGLSRQLQVSFGLKIEVLIEEELKFSLNTNYQAPTEGKVAVMIVTSDNLGHIWKAKSYILKNFQMINDKITGHGSIAGTLKYNLSEVQLTSFEKIEERYKLLFPEGHKKVDGKHPKLVPEEVLVPVVLKTKQSFTPKLQKEPKMKTESRTVGLSQFLHAFLCSDRKISHLNFDSKECRLSHFLSYKKDMVGKNDVLNCIDEATAIKVEASIDWLLGSKFVAREGLQVMVDLSEWKNREKKVGSINFSLPPTKNSSTEEVAKRLSRASLTSKPTSVRRENDKFVVTYYWRTTGPMVFDIITKMGWKAGQDSLGNLFVYVNDIPQPEACEITETLQPNEEILQVVEEEVENVSSSNPIYKSVEEYNMSASAQEITPVVLSEEEVLYEAKVLELKILRSNARLFLKLPLEMQKDINDILFKEEHIIDEAISLLSFFKK